MYNNGTGKAVKGGKIPPNAQWAQMQGKSHKEHDCQKVCVGWFYAQYKTTPIARLLFTIPNQAIGMGGGYGFGNYFKSEGVVAGVSDLLFLYPARGYHGLAIEFKTETGRQSQAQKDWQSAVENVGYKYVVVRNFDQFFYLIRFWLGEIDEIPEKFRQKK